MPAAVTRKGYSSKELKLIKTIWDDTKVVAQSKMQLCIDLWELKQELDSNDPNVGSGGNGTKSRFWSAFEQKDLPEYVVGNRSSVEDWLLAAEFTKSGSLPGAPCNALLALTPSTVCNLSRIQHPKAKAIAEHHLQVHEFIGHDAANYLAKTELDDEVLDEISGWVLANKKMALVPSVIRKIEKDVVASRRPASSHVIEIGTNAEPSPEFKQVLQSIRDERPQREQNARVNAVKEELARPERERLQRLEDQVRKYDSKLIAATNAVHDLLIYLQGVDRMDGTEYLEDMRGIDVMGLVSVANDLPRIKKIGEELMELAKLANSCNPPTGIDMTTFEVEAE
jgi:hypothetical protein